MIKDIEMASSSIRQFRGHYPLLDALRLFAAILVVAEHLRSALFVPFSTLQGSEKLAAPFYAATSVGHQAVLIFFALSGYLVGGGVISQFRAQTWSTRKYILRRLTRLWIVLIPALVATFVVDAIVSSVFGPDIFDGGRESVASLPTKLEPADYSFLTFISNMLFLQTIISPVYGSNGPLWSLSYEFWYYVLFPLGVFSVLGNSWALRIISLSAMLGVAFLLPLIILKLGVVWLAGALLSTNIGSRLPFRNTSSWPPVIASGVIVLLLAASLLEALPGGDVAFGLMVAACLPYLCQGTDTVNAWTKTASFGAEFSYSLYLFHFPLVIAVGAMFGFEQRFQPSTFAYISFAIAGVFIVGLCVVSWALCERHTNTVYRRLVDAFALENDKRV